MADVEIRDGTQITAHNAATMVAGLTSDSYWHRKYGAGPKYVEVAISYASDVGAVTIYVEHTQGAGSQAAWNVLATSNALNGETLVFFAPQGFFRIRVAAVTSPQNITVTVDLTAQLDVFDPEFGVVTVADSLALGDLDELRFGDGVGGDVRVAWDASNLEFLPRADDVGSLRIGDGTTDFDFCVFLGAALDVVLFDVGNKALQIQGASRLDFLLSNVAAANTDGGIIRGGVVGTQITEDTAGMKFISFYFDNGATSGTNVGFDLNVYATGAGQTVRGLNVFVENSDVAATNVSVIRAELQNLATGSATGFANVFDARYQLNNSGAGDGSVALFAGALDAAGSASDPAGDDELAFLKFELTGDATGGADIDDDAVLLNLVGWTEGTGNLIMDITDGAADVVSDGSIKIKIGANIRYLYYYDNEAT